ncbi:MAG: AAA family ATPase [Clostridiales bacterium]|nr:AAA family ATPase [Clostridiales bacterium]
MKKLPLGMQSFREIIEGDYVYVDKTQYIYNLVNDAKYCFLSRPRRFGKSLLLDTIGEVFSGDRELFKGLSIYDSDWGFEKTLPRYARAARRRWKTLAQGARTSLACSGKGRFQGIIMDANAENT